MERYVWTVDSLDGDGSVAVFTDSVAQADSLHGLIDLIAQDRWSAGEDGRSTRRIES
jgi:hypothetical protein